MIKIFLRAVVRLFIIALPLYAMLILWRQVAIDADNQQRVLQQTVGVKVSQMTAGSLSPILANKLNANNIISKTERESLETTLSEYMKLDDFIGIRIFNKYGETLAQVGQNNDIVSLTRAFNEPYHVHIAPIQKDGQLLGYLRFIVHDKTVASSQRDLFTQLQSMLNLAFILGIVSGGLIIRWYYVKARRVYSQQESQ